MNTDKIYAEQIANEYSVKTTSKVVQLKKLDKAAKRPATLFAYIFGIFFTLLFGFGLSISMKVIGDGSTLMMVLGVVCGIIGILFISVNYLIYKKILQKGKEKYASDIIRLAKEITEE